MYTDSEINETWLMSVSKAIYNSATSEKKIGIVIGGGWLARNSIEKAKKSGLTDTYNLDLIGIDSTRKNAELFRNKLEKMGADVNEKIPTTIKEAAQLLESHSIVIMGGTVPGHTTDTVSISLAVESGSDNCTIVTNVDFVYDQAPQNNPNAIPFEIMNLSQLQAIVGPPEHKGAGPNVVIDPIGVQVAIEQGIALSLLNGNKIENLSNRLSGKPFLGTIIEVD